MYEPQDDFINQSDYLNEYSSPGNFVFKGVRDNFYIWINPITGEEFTREITEAERIVHGL